MFLPIMTPTTGLERRSPSKRELRFFPPRMRKEELRKVSEQTKRYRLTSAAAVFHMTARAKRPAARVRAWRESPPPPLFMTPKTGGCCRRYGEQKDAGSRGFSRLGAGPKSAGSNDRRGLTFGPK